MFQKAAGNGKSSIYMSYDSLSKLEENLAITSYEVVMPNLTKGYAKKIVKDNIGISNSKCEIVECSDRYSFEALFKVIKNTGKRSMQTKAVVYPFWENASRGIEDVCALLLLLLLILSFIILVYVTFRLVIYVSKNGNNFKIWFLGKIKKIVKWFRKIYTTILKKNIV